MTNIDEDNKFKQKWWLHPMDPENLIELSDSDRRNAKSFNLWLLGWGIMFFGTILCMEPLPGGVEATPIWRMLIALSPLVPSIFLIRAFIRLFSEMKDELIKKVHYEALASGFLFAFFLGTCFGLSAIIIGASVKAGPFMFVGLLAGYFISLILKYRKYNV